MVGDGVVDVVNLDVIRETDTRGLEGEQGGVELVGGRIHGGRHPSPSTIKES